MAQDEQDVRLAAGVGVVPEHQRNKGYEKLGVKPGEGGIRSVGGGHEENLAALDRLAAAINGAGKGRQTTKGQA